MVTIKDIALEAGVSIGTVDRVIHNRGGVSKKTQEKIKLILKKRNFILNPVASALAMQKKHKIAVLIPEFTEEDIFWKSPYLGVLRAKDEVQSLGVTVEVFKFNHYKPTSFYNIFKKLLTTNPDAVIFVPMFFKETSIIVNALEKQGIKYMFLNIDFNTFNNSIYIGQDSRKAGFIAGKLMNLSVPKNGKFLIVRSRNDVGDNNAISKRIDGFNEFFTINNINSKIETLVIENFNDQIKIQKKIIHFLKESPDINGLFVPSSRISKVADCLSKEQLQRMTLIGFDNTPQNIQYLKKDNIAFLISQKPFDQGYEAIRTIKDYLLKNKLPQKKIYLPIDILVKENVMDNEMRDWTEKPFE